MAKPLNTAQVQTAAKISAVVYRVLKAEADARGADAGLSAFALIAVLARLEARVSPPETTALDCWNALTHDHIRDLFSLVYDEERRHARP